MMKHLINLLTLFILLTLTGHVANAAQITVVAFTKKDSPVKGVCFSFLNVGAVSPPTTAQGRTKVAISEGLKPGQSAELRVSCSKGNRQDWVIISPKDNRVTVPVRGDPVKVWLALRGDREVFESDEGLRAIGHSRVAEYNKQKAAQQPLTEELYQRIRAEESIKYGLPVEVIDAAFIAWTKRARDPSDIELIKSIKSVEKDLYGQGAQGVAGNITVLATKVDGNNVQTVNNAPQGFAISGGNVTNPTVNNVVINQEEKPKPRALSPDQKKVIMDFLANEPKGVFVIKANITIPDAWSYADQIAEPFRNSGWTVRIDSALITGPNTSGVWITIKNPEAVPLSCIVLKNALEAAGITFRAHYDPSGPDPGEVWLSVGSR